MRLPDIGPVVSFTFDDFPRTAYRVGGEILQRFGGRGSFYTAYGLLNTTSTSAGDLFRLDDLHSLVADGHELASHTLHHVSSRNTPTEAFVQEVLQGREAIREISGLTVTDNFAYPFGAVTAATKRVVGKQMLSCRGIFRGINKDLIDLNLLRANPLYGGIEQLDSILRLIRQNQEFKGWLIFYTHDVQRANSAFGCTPELLESVVKLSVDSSMKIMTVNDVLANGSASGRPAGVIPAVAESAKLFHDNVEQAADLKRT